MSSAPLQFTGYRFSSPAVRPRSGIHGGDLCTVLYGIRANPLLVTIIRCSKEEHSEDDRVATGFSSTEDLPVSTGDLPGSEKSEGEKFPKSFSAKKLLDKLKRYGVAGVLSYGLLNTAYYLTTFLLVWFYFAPAPVKMGYAAAVERFLKVMAMVWAGSQVTKIVRAGGALALAPFVDRGLRWFTNKFNFESEGKAFAAIAGVCFALALLLFFILTLLWA